MEIKTILTIVKLTFVIAGHVRNHGRGETTAQRDKEEEASSTASDTKQRQDIVHPQGRRNNITTRE